MSDSLTYANGSPVTPFDTRSYWQPYTGGFMPDTTNDFFSTILSNAKDAYKTYTDSQAQKREFDLQKLALMNRQTDGSSQGISLAAVSSYLPWVLGFFLVLIAILAFKR